MAPPMVLCIAGSCGLTSLSAELLGSEKGMQPQQHVVTTPVTWSHASHSHSNTTSGQPGS